MHGNADASAGVKLDKKNSKFNSNSFLFCHVKQTSITERPIQSTGNVKA